jgi:hypothetical protein
MRARKPGAFAAASGAAASSDFFDLKLNSPMEWIGGAGP